MKTVLTRFVLGTLVTGSLMISTAPALAHDYWRWPEREHRLSWERRAELRRDYRELAAARRQLEYDRAHGASRRRIVEDWRRIREIEREIYFDRWG
jgi:hypothetical protein